MGEGNILSVVAYVSDTWWKWVKGRSAPLLRDKSIQLALLRVMVRVCGIQQEGGQFIILGI